ncbi:deoxyribodipyrimidine photo-lyase [Iamia sp. SCSIO 61187]|nr:deoxyribodipyrimidine photo-lyase [Iamia sp. SCSIO 61187]
MWFRRDLRMADNPALVEAARADRVVALFVDDAHLREPSGANRRWFLAGCLAELHDRTGGALVVRRDEPERAVRDVAREVGAEVVCCADDAGPYGTRRDDAVRAALREDDVDLQTVGTPYAVSPGTLRTKGGTPFKVFTPFSRAWRAHGWDEPVDAPRGVRWVEGVRSDGLPEAPAVTADLPTPGEAAGRRRLAAFLDGDVRRYADDRDRPGADGTSRLSPYLKWGCVHPRQALARLGRGAGPETFATELAWRDFYADVLLHEPQSARQGLDERMAGMELDTGPEADARLAAWCEGRTGVPIVDAGMRQLVGAGWVHNRVRMIVASYLVKDLHIDWTRGARFFMEHLVDGDLASNQHGWQWVAGTGTDAAPYFRVFNPVAQSERFDPDGTYIRRWVPELADVPGKAIHDPTRLDGDLFAATAPDYPRPIVDHAMERDEALRRWRAATGRA